MKNDFQSLPLFSETTAAFLLLINRNIYRARFVTSQAIHIGEAGEWEVETKEGVVLVKFPHGRILDSQNRAWMKALLSIRPVNIVIPHDYPVSLSSLGVYPRYYLRFPRACSLTLESSIPIGV